MLSIYAFILKLLLLSTVFPLAFQTKRLSGSKPVEIIAIPKGEAFSDCAQGEYRTFKTYFLYVYLYLSLCVCKKR